jgi:hypothetical protein
MTSGSYWVYENWTHRRIRVHRATCSFCNDGRGLGIGRNGRNDTWYGDYSSREAAWSQVRHLQSRRKNGEWDIIDCNACAGD